jgi:hypothetical protein
MPSRICRDCKVKKGNRPGPRCYTCWVAAGKPTAEEAAAERAKNRLPDPPPVSEIKEDAPVLSTESEGELAAMQWVTTHAPGDERSWEQRSARQFKESAPAAFYARKAKLEEAAGAGAAGGAIVGQQWDGNGPCPCCGREAEKPIEDEGTQKILAMLNELDGREG